MTLISSSNRLTGIRRPTATTSGVVDCSRAPGVKRGSMPGGTTDTRDGFSLRSWMSSSRDDSESVMMRLRR